MSAADRPHAIGAPVHELFPDPATRTSISDRLTRELESALARVAHGPAAPITNAAGAQAALARFDFADPQPLDALLTWAIGQLEHGATHMTHPRYFGLFNPAPSFPAECADRIAGAFNTQLASATTSPAAVAIENHVIQAVAARAGLPAGAAGHFTSGGSEANATAVIAALTRACPGYAEHGVRAFAGPPMIYVSRESHLAWVKIAHQVGIGRAGVRLIETDGHGRMDMKELQADLFEDRVEGAIPVMIAATAGTTNAGAVDPLAETAAIAAREHMWLHADAAWGGALIASDRMRPLIAGIEAADSITIDAHKWLATTMGCGMFITRHASVLPQAFHVSTSFMTSNSASLDPYVTSMQWSRRFLGLRLFLALASAGWSGYGRHVERASKLMVLLGQLLRPHGWRVVNDPQMAVICLEPPAGPEAVAGIVKRVLASGQAWVSAAEFEHRAVVRACATNGLTTPDDVKLLAEALIAASAS